MENNVEKTGTQNGALTGVRVVDLARVLGGPFCGQILADLGADVIKVEPPQGDETRDYGPPFLEEEDGSRGNSAYFNGLNRNKRAMALDLRKPESHEILMRLLENCDILIENFKSGTLEKWGLGYQDVLAKRFPKLIHCTVTGFGVDGPLGGYPGYDAVLQAMSGLISVQGSKSSGPMRIAVPLIDLSAGMNAAIGVLAALRERDQSGKGQHVEAALYDTGLSLMHPHMANWFVTGKDPVLTGNSHPTIAPYTLFPTKTQDIFLGTGNDGQFRKLMTVLKREDVLEDERFKTNPDRITHRDALEEILTQILKGWDAEELSTFMLDRGVPAGPANTVTQALEHPHTAHREMVFEDGAYRGIASPIKLSRTPAIMKSAPPRYGADTTEIMGELGYTDTQINEFHKLGIVPKERKK